MMYQRILPELIAITMNYLLTIVTAYICQFQFYVGFSTYHQIYMLATCNRNTRCKKSMQAVNTNKMLVECTKSGHKRSANI